jgi:hypothetical protein
MFAIATLYGIAAIYIVDAFRPAKPATAGEPRPDES